MPRKKKSSRRSYSRTHSYSDDSSEDSRFSREDSRDRRHSSSRSRDDRYYREGSRSRDDRYYREGSRSRDDRHYREGSRSRDDHHRRSSREERYNRESSRDRSYRNDNDYSDDDDDDRRNSTGSRRSSYEKRRSSSYYSDEDNDRNERSRARNDERRARKGRRPKKEKSKKKLGRGAETNKQVQKRRNNNHFPNHNVATIGDNVKLKHTLEQEGLSIVDMSSDGNCLFRSVSDQLYNDRGHHHDEVRSDICDFMAENEDDFKMFLVVEGDGKNKHSRDAKDFDSYIADTRRDGVWGGNLELVAAARLYQRNITVYSATLSVFTIECDCEDTSGPDMLLSFHSGDHYNSVRANAGNKKHSRNGRKLTRNGSGGSSRRSLGDTVTTASTVSVSPATADSVSLNDTNIVVATVVGIDDVPVKKNAQCPCGSGKRYKKCCSINVKEEKNEGRRKKDKRNRGLSPLSLSRDRNDEDAVTSGFKVLQI